MTTTTYGEHPDVTFVFPLEHGAVVRAERLKLKQRSEVFRRMFSAEFLSNQPIEITDISVDIFNDLMKYIFNEFILTVSVANYREILYIATKYMIAPLIQKVISVAVNLMTQWNLGEHFETFERYQIKKLDDKIQEVFEMDPLTVIHNLKNGSDSEMRLVKLILQSPVLKCSEYALCDAVTRFMERTVVLSEEKMDIGEEMRRKFGKMIYLIRFPVMSLKELILCGKEPSLLPKDLFADLLLWVEAGEYSESVQFFSTKKRIPPSSGNCAICSKIIR
ncbi:BTB/POZ domain-containing protein 3-like [Lutzomyia longipalpis]|uniref:BTB/POZ domain-containing protein 3-like n=1 Tax=Lutzomyia longipalpis TaxID=7200 RepID=UPI002483C5DC|nr:BTB/POZ domain-containing protein 3-like [Lutzomyia longipalpis]